MECVYHIRPAPEAQAKITQLMKQGLQTNGEIERKLGRYTEALTD
jgi:hypothetical protein